MNSDPGPMGRGQHPGPMGPRSGLMEEQVPHTSEDLKEAKHVRKEFPETWLWTEVLAGYWTILSCLNGFGL